MVQSHEWNAQQITGKCAESMQREKETKVTDYRAMFDRDYIGAWDLGGQDVTVRITKVQAGELIAQGGRKSKKPLCWFEGKEKGFVFNKTNAKIVAAMYGNDTAAWIGKRITLYPTTTQMGGETVDCIRVRPSIPKARAANGSKRTAEPELEPAASDPAEDFPRE